MAIQTFNVVEMLNVVWFDATGSLGFPCHNSEHAPLQNPSNNLLHTQSTLQSQTCIRLSLPSKGYKIHLSCHFSLEKHYNRIRAIISLQDSYLRTTCNANLSPTQPPNIKILFKRDSSSRKQTGMTAVGVRGSRITL